MPGGRLAQNNHVERSLILTHPPGKQKLPLRSTASCAASYGSSWDPATKGRAAWNSMLRCPRRSDAKSGAGQERGNWRQREDRSRIFFLPQVTCMDVSPVMTRQLKMLRLFNLEARFWPECRGFSKTRLLSHRVVGSRGFSPLL